MRTGRLDRGDPVERIRTYKPSWEPEQKILTQLLSSMHDPFECSNYATAPAKCLTFVARCEVGEESCLGASFVNFTIMRRHLCCRLVVKAGAYRLSKPCPWLCQ